MSTELALKSDSASQTTQFVSVHIDKQLFGLPIESVHEVFVPDSITPVPLAPPEAEGVLNLRGRIVTVVNMRRLLNLPRNEKAGGMAVGVEFKGETYGLLIDEVGEVLTLENAKRLPNPSNLDPRWAQISNGVYRLPGVLMVILDVERALSRLTVVA